MYHGGVVIFPAKATLNRGSTLCIEEVRLISELTEASAHCTSEFGDGLHFELRSICLKYGLRECALCLLM